MAVVGVGVEVETSPEGVGEGVETSPVGVGVNVGTPLVGVGDGVKVGAEVMVGVVGVARLKANPVQEFDPTAWGRLSGAVGAIGLCLRL